MATRKSSSKPKPAPKAAPERVASCKARQQVAMHATWQLESVLKGICEIARKEPDISAQGRLLALSMRAVDVNGAAMTAVCDSDLDRDAVIELWRTLNTDDFGTGAEVANG